MSIFKDLWSLWFHFPLQSHVEHWSTNVIAVCIPYWSESFTEELASLKIMTNFNGYNLYLASSGKQATVRFLFIGFLLISSFPLVAYLHSYECNNASAGAEGDTFWGYFTYVMSDLLANAPETGFKTSSYGESPNIVHGLLQCSGSISQKDCSICSRKALDAVIQLCGNSTGGRVWLDNCFLRYDKSSFFSKLDTHGNYVENVKDISTNDPKKFSNATFNFLSNLSDTAYVHANKGFAEGSVAYSSGGLTIYGLVQCWRDISIKDCRSCLEFARKSLYDCCSMKQGARALLGSCTVRYEIHPFFHTSTVSNTNTSPPANPPKGAAQAPRPNGGSNTGTSPPANAALPRLTSNAYIISLWCWFSFIICAIWDHTIQLL